MDAKECLKILREIRDCSFATVNEEGKPENRIIDVMLVEGEKLYFCTARGKDFYKQLEKNPYVAISGLNDQWQSIRLSGKVEKLEEQKKWINRIFEENPSLKVVYPGNTRFSLETFCISEGVMEFFDIKATPIYRESFVLGDTKEEVKGYCMTYRCIACGACIRGCSQKCVQKSDNDDIPYEIIQENCIRCGRCFENCPVGAIKRIGA